MYESYSLKQEETFFNCTARSKSRFLPDYPWTEAHKFDRAAAGANEGSAVRASPLPKPQTHAVRRPVGSVWLVATAIVLCQKQNPDNSACDR